MDRSRQQESSVSAHNVAFISDGEIRYVKVENDSMHKKDIVERVTPIISKVTRTNLTTKSSATKPKMYTIRLKNGKICSSKPINVSGQPTSSSSKENINKKQIKITQTAAKSELGNKPDTHKQKIQPKPMKIISVPQKTPSTQRYDELSSLQKIKVRDVTDASKSSRTTAAKAVAIRSSTFDAESDDDSSHSNDDAMDIPNLNNIEIIDASESDDGFDSQPATEVDMPAELGITKKPPVKDEHLEDVKCNTKKLSMSSQTVATLKSAIPSRTVAGSKIVKPSKDVPPSSKTVSGIYKVSKPATVAAPTVVKSEAPALITSTPILPQACSRVINKTIATKPVTTAVSASSDFKVTNVTYALNKTSTPQTTRHVNIRPKPFLPSPAVPSSTDSSILKASSVSPNSNNFNIVVPKEDIIRCKQTNTPLILAVPPLVPLKDSSGSAASPAGGNLLMLLPHQLPSNLQPPGVVNFLVSNLQKKSVSTIQLPPELSGGTNTSMIPPLQMITNQPGASKNMSQIDPLSGTTDDTKTGLPEQFPEVPKILNTREKDGPNWCWYAPKFGKRDLEGFLYKDRLGFSKSDVTQSKRCLRKLSLAIYKKQEELDRLAARIIRIKRGFKDTPPPPKMRFRFPDKSRRAAPLHEPGTTTRATKDIVAHKIKLSGSGRGRRERPAESLKEMIDSKKIKLVELPLLKKKSEENSITSTIPPEKKQPDTNVDENESDLYFTRKVVILRNKVPIRRKARKIGRLPKIRLQSSRDLQMKARRRQWTASAPPVKECSIVLERDEKIEEMIKDNCEGRVENVSEVRSSRKRKLDLEGMGLIKKVRRRNAIDSPLVTNQKSKSHSEEVNDKDVTKARTVSADDNYSDDMTSDVGSSSWVSDRFKDSHSTTQKSTQTDYKKSVFKSYREYQKITKLSPTEINFIFTLNTIQSLQDLRINENKPILLLDQFNYHFDVDLINYNVLFIRDDDEPIPAPLMKNLEMVYFVRCGYIKVVSRPVICKYILEKCDMRKKIDDKKVKELEQKKSKREGKPKSPPLLESEQKSEITKDPAKKQGETKLKGSSIRKEEQKSIAKDDFAKHLSLKSVSGKKKMPIFTKSVSREHSRKPTGSASSIKKDEKHRSKQSSTRDETESKNVPQTSEKPVADTKSKASAARKEARKDSDTLDKKFFEIEKNLSEMFEKPGTSLSTSGETLTESVPQKSTEGGIIDDESESASGKVKSKAATSLEDLFVMSSDENTNLASKMKDSQESLDKETTTFKHSESGFEKQSETQGDSKEKNCTDNLVNLLVSAMKASDQTEECQDQGEGENEKSDNTTVENCENKNPEKGTQETEDWNKDVEIEQFASLACGTITHPEVISDPGNKISETPGKVSSDNEIVAEPMNVDIPSQVQESGGPTEIASQRDEENVPATSDGDGSEKDPSIPRNQEKILPERNVSEDPNQCDRTSEVPESELNKTEEKVEENEQIDSEIIETMNSEEEESKQRGVSESKASHEITEQEEEEKHMQSGVSESKAPQEITEQREEEEEKYMQPVSESEVAHEITEQEEGESMPPVFKSDLPPEITELNTDKDNSLKESGKPEVISDLEAKECAESDDELNISKKLSTDLDMDQFLTKRSSDVAICSQESTLDVDQFLNKSNESVDDTSISAYYKGDNKSLDDPIAEIGDSENTFNLGSETIDESTFVSKDASLMMEESDSSVPVLAVEPESSINEKDVSSEDILFENVKNAESLAESSSKTELSPYQTKDTVSDVNLEPVIDDESKAELFGEGEEANADVASSSITFDVKPDSSVSSIADLSANIDTEEQLLSSCDMDSDLAIRSDEISKDLPDDYLEK